MRWLAFTVVQCDVRMATIIHSSAVLVPLTKHELQASSSPVISILLPSSLHGFVGAASYTYTPHVFGFGRFPFFRHTGLLMVSTEVLQLTVVGTHCAVSFLNNMSRSTDYVPRGLCI